jgi:YidC/Oxa1 family membrane protein insertase
MKLYKDHGTNPISGCLPLILQLPIFFALFRVMNEVKPKGDGSFHGKFGLSDELIQQAAHAKVFGAPISAAFNSSPRLLSQLDGNATTVKIVAALMVVTMGLTTFLTQKQMMARTGGQLDPQQAQVQKIMLYVLPLSFAVFGFSFPIGVLLYWLTTNVWSMGQQRWVIARMPPVLPGGPTAKGGKAGPDGESDGGRRSRRPKPSDDGTPSETPEPPAASVPQQATADDSRVQTTRPAGPRPGGARSAGSRKNKKRKGGRR